MDTTSRQYEQTHDYLPSSLLISGNNVLGRDYQATLTSRNEISYSAFSPG